MLLKYEIHVKFDFANDQRYPLLTRFSKDLDSALGFKCNLNGRISYIIGTLHTLRLDRGCLQKDYQLSHVRHMIRVKLTTSFCDQVVSKSRLQDNCDKNDGGMTFLVKNCPNNTQERL